jgi:hypothetical protein
MQVLSTGSMFAVVTAGAVLAVLFLLVGTALLVSASRQRTAAAIRMHFVILATVMQLIVASLTIVCTRTCVSVHAAACIA